MLFDLQLEKRTIGTQLAMRVAQSECKPFIVYSGHSWSFGDVDTVARSFARGLVANGIRQGDRIMLMLPNCPEFVFAWFGASLVRAVTIPIDPRLRGRLLEYALSDAQPRQLVIASGLLEALHDIDPIFLEAIERITVVEMAEQGVKSASLASSSKYTSWNAALIESGEDPERPADFQDLNMVMYTSGSTGPSKGVMMPNAHIFSSGIAMMRAVDLNPDDLLFTPFPLFHGMSSRIGVLPALLMGIPINIGANFSVSNYWQQVTESSATIGIVVPTITSLLMAREPGPWDRAHQIRAMFNSRSNEAFESRFNTILVESYGTTETSHIITAPWSDRRPGSCGRAHEDWDVRLVDEKGRQVPSGGIGEVVARPRREAIMMMGYLNKPEATREAMPDGWYHTGDFGFFDGDGYFHFSGRKAERIRRLGENISSLEIEELVTSHPDVGECAALPYPARVGEDDIRLAVVLKSGKSISAQDLSQWLDGRLPRFMMPRYIEFLDNLPRTETGKISKRPLIVARLSEKVWDRETGSDVVPRASARGSIA